MNLATLTSATTTKLNPADFAPTDSTELGMLLAIAGATEEKRASLRNDARWGTRIPTPPRGLQTVAQRHQHRALADYLPWPALLTMDQCADEAARRSGCPDRQTLLDFALSICPIDQWMTLVNFIARDSAIATTAKILSPLIRGLKDKEARIKRGASVGGVKSARERQKNSTVPQLAKLLQERQGLLDSGKEFKETAGILARRYGVDASTIRRKLRGATINQAKGSQQ
ncbi:hypothetical protein ATF69_3761 [Acidovorax delafieldii]|uniref:Uncharacterized protein n=1 Tax=Acidovorax delafieldii TaxID=47920 RepID=A0A561XF57_ACIDE|nr:hypothetical protein [Acidovorax delafieldii]TWG34754.1 hypothetical protein ATF69_3761 [Acidovorax delafieldii]